MNELCKEDGLTIVMVLHDINQAIQYSDQIMIMKDGELVHQGKPEEVISEGVLADVYGIRVMIKEETGIGKYIVPMGL